MKNKFTDLNNHLFAQLERLGDEDLKGEQLQNEVARSKAITSVASQVVNNARLALDVTKFQADGMALNQTMPTMLEAKK